MKPACQQEHRCQQDQEESTSKQIVVGTHADGVPPVVDPGIANINGVACPGAGECFDRPWTQLGIPDSVRDRTSI